MILKKRFPDISAVVLAGGKASRFGGRNKALIEVDGVPIINRTLTLLEPLFREIILAGWPGESPLPPGVITVDDNFPGLGPLGGIEAAMKVSSSPVIFVLGGDMPWLSGELIESQARDFAREPADILVARIGELAEPLHSLYSRPFTAGWRDTSVQEAVQPSSTFTGWFIQDITICPAP
ncbi:MAG: molybdenum cofactor guanylyltransferase [Bacteroidales bacterium]|nr:molybdenum cofactor guanylyltransferase [Bacteroidales bacterium]